MNLLAVETATDACSVALLHDGAMVSRHHVAPRRHTAMVLGLLDELLAEARLERADVDAVAFGHGPGSFTGVRVAATLAQGIAFPRNLPVVPVSTLAALAAGAARRGHVGRVVTVMDARRAEIYAAAFAAGDGAVERLTADAVMRPEDLALPAGGDWLAAGTGWAPYADRFAPALRALPRADHDLPEAVDVAALAVLELAAGNAVTAADAAPLYLRGAVE